MKITEIFESIEGEGVRAGTLVTFIRFHGCNLRCAYCDTRYSYEEDPAMTVSIDEILSVVDNFGNKCVTITGGEPLIQPGITTLLLALAARDYQVNVETNGSIVPELREEALYDGMSPLDRRHVKTIIGELHPESIKHMMYKNVFFTMDYKLKCSGQQEKMDINNLNCLLPNDVLKFVVGSTEDMDTAVDVIDSIKSTPTIYFSPVFGQIEPKAIAEYIKYHKLQNVKVQVQLHKILWDPDERGV